jgi:predicted  nucleic acid-binding Zn-ribbon protein
VKVNSVRQACREWAKFPYEYKEAKAYEKEYQELKKKNNRQTEELAETFDWSAFGELGKEMQSLTESESSDSIVESWFDK